MAARCEDRKSRRRPTRALTVNANLTRPKTEKQQKQSETMKETELKKMEQRMISAEKRVASMSQKVTAIAQKAASSASKAMKSGAGSVKNHLSGIKQELLKHLPLERLHKLHALHQVVPDCVLSVPILPAQAGEPHTSRSVTFNYRGVVRNGTTSEYTVLMPSPKSVIPLTTATVTTGASALVPTHANLNVNRPTLGSWFPGPDISYVDVEPTTAAASVADLSDGGAATYSLMSGLAKVTFVTTVNESIEYVIIDCSRTNHLVRVHTNGSDGDPEDIENRHYCWVSKTGNMLNMDTLYNSGDPQRIGENQTAVVAISCANLRPSDWFTMGNTGANTAAGATDYAYANVRNCLANGQQVLIYRVIQGNPLVKVEGYNVLNLTTTQNNFLLDKTTSSTPKSSLTDMPQVAAHVAGEGKDWIAARKNQLLRGLQLCNKLGHDTSIVRAAMDLPIPDFCSSTSTEPMPIVHSTAGISPMAALSPLLNHPVAATAVAAVTGLAAGAGALWNSASDADRAKLKTSLSKTLNGTEKLSAGLGDVAGVVGDTLGLTADSVRSAASAVTRLWHSLF